MYALVDFFSCAFAGAFVRVCFSVYVFAYDRPRLAATRPDQVPDGAGGPMMAPRARPQGPIPRATGYALGTLGPFFGGWRVRGF